MKTKIIAECGYNHNGSFDKAKEMIDSAADLGLWAVKFQKWNIDGFPDKIKKQKRTDKNAYGKTQYDHRKALEFSIKEILELKEYAEDKGLIFICSGKDFVSIRQLVEAGVKYIKLPSQRYKDHEIYKYLSREKIKKNLFILVSTGMCTDAEIPRSKWTKEADVVMHCISLYPVKLNDCNLGVITKYPFINGYSSHSLNGEEIDYAVCAGAKYIERHFTLDKNDKGSDHKLSADPAEMREIITSLIGIEDIMSDRVMTDKEWEIRRYYRSF